MFTYPRKAQIYLNKPTSLSMLKLLFISMYAFLDSMHSSVKMCIFVTKIKDRKMHCINSCKI